MTTVDAGTADTSETLKVPETLTSELPEASSDPESDYDDLTPETR
jgi:hypothetical protein